MGIARSSFYSTFGSKQKVLWRALELYTCELLARMRDAAAAESTPRATWRCAASASTTSTRWTACSRPCSSHSASMPGAQIEPERTWIANGRSFRVDLAAEIGSRREEPAQHRRLGVPADPDTSARIPFPNGTESGVDGGDDLMPSG